MNTHLTAPKLQNYISPSGACLQDFVSPKPQIPPLNMGFYQGQGHQIQHQQQQQLMMNNIQNQNNKTNALQLQEYESEDQEDEEENDILRYEQQQNLQEEHENEEIEEFKLQIEKKFKRSVANKIYTFPKKHSTQSSQFEESDSDSSLASLLKVKKYDLYSQNEPKKAKIHFNSGTASTKNQTLDSLQKSIQNSIFTLISNQVASSSLSSSHNRQQQIVSGHSQIKNSNNEMNFNNSGDFYGYGNAELKKNLPNVEVSVKNIETQEKPKSNVQFSGEGIPKAKDFINKEPSRKVDERLITEGDVIGDDEFNNEDNEQNYNPGMVLMGNESEISEDVVRLEDDTNYYGKQQPPNKVITQNKEKEKEIVANQNDSKQQLHRQALSKLILKQILSQKQESKITNNSSNAQVSNLKIHPQDTKVQVRIQTETCNNNYKFNEEDDMKIQNHMRFHTDGSENHKNARCSTQSAQKKSQIQNLSQKKKQTNQTFSTQNNNLNSSLLLLQQQQQKNQSYLNPAQANSSFTYNIYPPNQKNIPNFDAFKKLVLKPSPPQKRILKTPIRDSQHPIAASFDGNLSKHSFNQSGSKRNQNSTIQQTQSIINNSQNMSIQMQIENLKFQSQLFNTKPDQESRQPFNPQKGYSSLDTQNYKQYQTNPISNSQQQLLERPATLQSVQENRKQDIPMHLMLAQLQQLNNNNNNNNYNTSANRSTHSTSPNCIKFNNYNQQQQQVLPPQENQHLKQCQWQQQQQSYLQQQQQQTQYLQQTEQQQQIQPQQLMQFQNYQQLNQISSSNTSLPEENKYQQKSVLSSQRRQKTNKQVQNILQSASIALSSLSQNKRASSNLSKGRDISPNEKAQERKLKSSLERCYSGMSDSSKKNNSLQYSKSNPKYCNPQKQIANIKQKPTQKQAKKSPSLSQHFKKERQESSSQMRTSIERIRTEPATESRNDNSLNISSNRQQSNNRPPISQVHKQLSYILQDQGIKQASAGKLNAQKQNSNNRSILNQKGVSLSFNKSIEKYQGSGVKSIIEKQQSKRK